MSIQITHVHFEEFQKTEAAITNYRWRGLESGEVGESTKPDLVQWINSGGQAFVGSGTNRVPVGVINPENGKPYLRTYADGKWTNNLVELPLF
ncbi:DUF3892 domain-containing protein [Corynebacterium sp. H127]